MNANTKNPQIEHCQCPKIWHDIQDWLVQFTDQKKTSKK